MTNGDLSPRDDEGEWLSKISARTPARVFVDRSGLSYRTATWLALRQDHAAAADAVHAEINLQQDLGAEFIDRFKLVVVQSRANNKEEFLLRPELGRQLSDQARQVLSDHCPVNPDVQIVIGDGLSAAAVRAQVPHLLPNLQRLAGQRGWQLGQTFVVRYCRVGIMNDIGEILSPRVVVLLIGERPGLATAESLSAYMAYRPCCGHTDAQRNLISNIHARGVACDVAAERIVRLAEKMMAASTSGVTVKEDFEQGRIGN